MDIAKILYEKEGLELPAHLESAFRKVIVEQNLTNADDDKIVELFAKTFCVNFLPSSSFRHNGWDEQRIWFAEPYKGGGFEYGGARHGYKYEATISTVEMDLNGKEIKGEGEEIYLALLDGMLKSCHNQKMKIVKVESHTHELNDNMGRRSQVAFYAEFSIQYPNGQNAALFGVGVGKDKDEASQQAAFSAASQIPLVVSSLKDGLWKGSESSSGVLAKMLVEKEGLNIPNDLEAAFHEVVKDKQFLTPEETVEVFWKTFCVHLGDDERDGHLLCYDSQVSYGTSMHYKGKQVTYVYDCAIMPKGAGGSAYSKEVKGEGEQPYLALLNGIFYQKENWKVVVMNTYTQKIPESHRSEGKKIAFYLHCSAQHPNGQNASIFGVGIRSKQSYATIDAVFSLASQLFKMSSSEPLQFWGLPEEETGKRYKQEGDSITFYDGGSVEL